MPGMQRRAWALSLPIALLGVAAGGLALRAGDAREPSYAQYYGPLTAQEYAFAVTIAKRDYGRHGNRIVVATARAYRGLVRYEPNLSGTCSSGRILEVDLAGSFPGAVMSANNSDASARPEQETIYQADATTGEPCLVRLSEGGPFNRDTRAANLLPALRAGR